jgi:VWFA-related protein
MPGESLAKAHSRERSGYGRSLAKAERRTQRPRCPFPRAVSRVCAWVAVSCLLPATDCLLLAGQQGPAGLGVNTNTGTFVFRKQTNVVLVDVRVWDRSGKPVTDLKQRDFRVYEDGVEQKINSFSLENVEELAKATGESAPPPVINLAKLPPTTPATQVTQALQNHRLIVLFFDLTSMPVDDLMLALQATRDFITQKLTPADLVAVATYSSDLRLVQHFTNDRDALQKALETIRIGEASDLAQPGAEGAAGGTNASGEQIVAQDVSAAFTPDETEFNIFNTDEKLAALQSLADLLRNVPGRKSVIHFSSGIERTGVENEAQLRATEDAANQANVSLYTVDARALAALPAGGDASSASPAGTAVYTGSAAFSQVTQLESGRETLASLAADTGGRTFYDLNDFSPVFSEVQKENSSYYLLGYTPSNTRSDGKFRRIKVEVDRPGVKIQARPGYFAPKNFRQFTREDKELQLQQAMELDAPFVDLPLAVETARFRRPDGKYYVLLAAKIPGSALSFLQKSSTHRTEFDFAWRATDTAGHTAAALRDTLPVKLDPETYQQVLTGNILYEGGIVLPPGKYKLKVVARENESGKIGTFEQPLILPEIPQTPPEPGLLLSSVVLSNEIQEQSGGKGKSKKTGDNPLDLGGRIVLPSVTNVFRTSQNLYIYLESYLAGRQESAPIPPSVALVFFRGGVQISEAGPYPGKLDKSSKTGKAVYFVQIPLAQFPPGRYWMQVNVLDPASDRVAFARVPLAVMRGPARGKASGR